MSRADRPRAGVSVTGLSKGYGKTTVLGGIDLTVQPGEFICLLGPSGCGKTTLLRSVAGLEQPDSGRITIGERVVVDVEQRVFVPPEQRRLGMVFQHYALWPHMTVRENIAYPLRKQHVPAREIGERILRIMDTVGLPSLLERRPSQLSGGQQQRVALARALVYEPPVLLLDEPLSNLDATLRVQLRRELRQLHERLGTTTVLVTHDQEEAASLADTIAVMHHGRIVQAGPAHEVLDAPRTRFVAEFVGFDNVFSGRILDCDGAHTRVAMADGVEFLLPTTANLPSRGAVVTIATRSDALRMRDVDAAPAGASMLRGELRHVVRNGRGLDFEVTAGGQVILVRDSGRERAGAFVPGCPVAIDFPAGSAVVLSAPTTE